MITSDGVEVSQALAVRILTLLIWICPVMIFAYFCGVSTLITLILAALSVVSKAFSDGIYEFLYGHLPKRKSP